MSQAQIEQFNSEEMSLLEKLEELFESAETELQKTATLLELKFTAEDAFEGVLLITKEIEGIALQLKHEDTRMVASEKLVLFNERFKEVMSQLHPIKQEV